MKSYTHPAIQLFFTEGFLTNLSHNHKIIKIITPLSLIASNYILLIQQ